MPCYLPSGDENDISLAGIRISIFQKEYFVNSIILQSREVDKKTYRTSQIFFQDQILLSANLYIGQSAPPVIRRLDRSGQAYLRLQVGAADLSAPLV